MIRSGGKSAKSHSSSTYVLVDAAPSYYGVPLRLVLTSNVKAEQQVQKQRRAGGPDAPHVSRTRRLS
jgi:hypothetical protein